ncbi:MAG: hypothetical protein ACRD3Z_01350 [Nitrososphaerales archaeon]
MKTAILAVPMFLVAIVAILPVANAVVTASVQQVDKQSGPNLLVPDIAISKGIYTAASNGADFGFIIIYSYESLTGPITITFEESISTAEFVSNVDKKTVLVRTEVPVEELPDEALNWTAKIVNMKTGKMIGVESSGTLPCDSDTCE